MRISDWSSDVCSSDLLEERVDSFIDDLVAQDENSPEFGKRIDQITNMGRKEMLEAASHSNRFLDRPIKAMDRDTDIGQNLIELRGTVERPDPPANGKTFSKLRDRKSVV